MSRSARTAGTAASPRCSAASRWTGRRVFFETREHAGRRRHRRGVPGHLRAAPVHPALLRRVRALGRQHDLGLQRRQRRRTTPRSPRSRRRAAGSSSRPPRRSSPPTRTRGRTRRVRAVRRDHQPDLARSRRWHRPAPVGVRGCVDRRHARLLPDVREARGRRHGRDLARRLRAQRRRHHPDHAPARRPRTATRSRSGEATLWTARAPSSRPTSSSSAGDTDACADTYAREAPIAGYPRPMGPARCGWRSCRPTRPVPRPNREHGPAAGAIRRATHRRSARRC